MPDPSAKQLFDQGQLSVLPTYLQRVDQISARMAQRLDALTRRIEALEAAAARDQQPDPPVHDPKVHSVDAATGRPITRSSGRYAGLRQGWHTG